MSKTKNKSELYYRILELGIENLEEGLTYQDVLRSIGQENDNTITKYLFTRSFEDSNCSCPTPAESPSFDHLNKCKRLITNESIMNFFQMKESNKNRRTSERALCISLASLGTALLILASNLARPKFNEIFHTTEYTKLTSELNESMSNINLSIVQLGQLNSIHQVNDSLQIAKFMEETNLVNHEKTLKKLNYNIYKLNKTLNERIKNERESSSRLLQR